MKSYREKMKNVETNPQTLDLGSIPSGVSIYQPLAAVCPKVVPNFLGEGAK
jgi:hypothetical protein